MGPLVEELEVLEAIFMACLIIIGGFQCLDSRMKLSGVSTARQSFSFSLQRLPALQCQRWACCLVRTTTKSRDTELKLPIILHKRHPHFDIRSLLLEPTQQKDR